MVNFGSKKMNQDIFDENYIEKLEARTKLSDNHVRIMHEKQMPMLVDEEVELAAFKSELGDIGMKREHLDVLEWGSGYSTFYYPNFLRGLGITTTWEAIEADLRWYLEVNKLELPLTTRVHLFEEPILKTILTPILLHNSASGKSSSFFLSPPLANISGFNSSIALHTSGFTDFKI